jgi:succinate dehydrogenase / fumarate reductase cytochrome b subunit
MDLSVKSKQRPVNLDLQSIRFPITAIASILHRISGVITFFSLAILLALLSESLGSPEGFDNVQLLLNNFIIKFVLWAIATALLYHIVGGIRHMIMDLGYWEELDTGAVSAKAAFVVTLILAILMGVLIW